MFKRVCTTLREGDIMLARLRFIHSLADFYQPYLTKLLSESTIIHVLYDELVQLLRLLLQRFVKADAQIRRMLSSAASIWNADLWRSVILVQKP